ncbi:triose-phosphate isomerase [Neorickettsia risticii]|uniref:Triosephosphate isomerase n=1 Tax=Neorickettsia risticii (strain Illinois) TaxID=434131 RepID=C6V4B9_NEORI|nr:triose-phosphate isomerase [Neorickettsia risticii]ACT69236.1 triose-phosphate isomerase [Neorickettsia risticii str. Illinois]
MATSEFSDKGFFLSVEIDIMDSRKDILESMETCVQRFVVANWKMNGSQQLCDVFVNRFSTFAFNPAVEIVIAPPAVYLGQMRTAVMSSDLPLALGAQDCASGDNTPSTGDISSRMFKEVGARYVLVGHSERRTLHCESSKVVGMKANAGLRSRLIPIICVGQNNRSISRESLTKQCRDSIPMNSHDFIVAYEPVYAIGTGIVPSNEEIEEAVSLIKGAVGDAVPVLYGGSVSPANCSEIFGVKNLGGVLVGGASLDPDSFIKICEVANRF